MADLLALDWGTSSLRAFLMKDGVVVESRKSPYGIQKLPAPGGIEGFEAAFAEVCADWLVKYPSIPAVTGGMVGSANGWVEAPYVTVPAKLHSLTDGFGEIRTKSGFVIHVVPGLLLDDADKTPDVIRGEEIQILGALDDNPELDAACTVVLPGTHSKWVTVEAGAVTYFRTYITGELFDVLGHHSVVGRLIEHDADFDEAGFEAGISLAENAGLGDLTAQLFSTRASALAGRLKPSQLKSYLSGMLIGHELVSARAKMDPEAPVLMIGEGALCALYTHAMALMGIPLTRSLSNTAPSGLWAFAKARGLVGDIQEKGEAA